jgi:hypothetical protein
VPHTPESWWEIEVTGDSDNLRLLREVLVNEALSIRREDGKDVLRVAELNELEDVGVVRSRARSLIASLSGAAKLLLGWTVPLDAGNIVRRHPDGHCDYFLEVGSARLTLRTFPPTLRFTRSDGTVEERRPGEEILTWLKHAKDRDEVRRVLRLVSEPDLGWVELYRIVDVIHEAAGASIETWVSKAELRRFKHTANSIGAVGDEARHGRERGRPPRRPMQIHEARKLVIDLAKRWLNDMSKQEHRESTDHRRGRHRGLDSDERKAWMERLGVVGRAQARYLWLLLIAGIFYLALHLQVADPAATQARELVVPVVDLTLSAIPVWASGPIVLSTLLLAAHGSLRAYKTAAAAVGVEGFGVGEEYDLAPNALDFVVYTTPASPRWTRGVLLFTYPLYMALFCAEAWWLLLAVHADAPALVRAIFVPLGGLLALFATWRVMSYLWTNGHRARRVIRGEGGV